jgi:hypothetical protein
MLPIKRKLVCGVLGQIELIGRRLIDRHGNGRRRRVRTIACVQDDSFRVLALCRHVSSVKIIEKKNGSR